MTPNNNNKIDEQKYNEIKMKYENLTKQFQELLSKFTQHRNIKFDWNQKLRALGQSLVCFYFIFLFL